MSNKVNPAHESETKQIPFVDLRVQTRAIDSEVRSAISRVVSNCNFILGEEVETFEKEFASFVGVEHAIGIGSGFDALCLSLMALDLAPGDEIIIPANTFIATAFAVSHAKGSVVLVDCDRGTYNIDVSQIESAITSRTRAIIPVHLTGQPADMGPILEIATTHNLAVVEDACQAHGAAYHGKSCGSLGDLGCFSFYPGKNLGAFGDGGMVVTNDNPLAQRLRQLRHCGQEQKNVHVVKGVNSRLDTLQAAVLNVKLGHLNNWNKSREGIAKQYMAELDGVGDLVFQERVPNSSHVFHLFVIESDQRDALQVHLADHGIQTGIHYPIPIHLQPAFADLEYREGSFPNAEALAKRMLSLPMYPELTETQVERATDCIRAFFNS